MNYGGPVMGAVIIFALLDWVIGGRKRFQVPVDVRARTIDVDSLASLICIHVHTGEKGEGELVVDYY